MSALVYCLNRVGFYLLGVVGEGSGQLEYCRLTRGPNVERKRHDVLGFLLALNMLEILVGVSCFFPPLSSYPILHLIKLCWTFVTLFFYLNPRKRQQETVCTINTTLLTGSGLSCLALFSVQRDEVNWVLGGLSLAVTMSLCLLPAYGRKKLVSTLLVCWAFVVAFISTGLVVFRLVDCSLSTESVAGIVASASFLIMFGSRYLSSTVLVWSWSSLLAVVVTGLISHQESAGESSQRLRGVAEVGTVSMMLIFFANVVCTCKHVLFLNKEEIASLFATQRPSKMDVLKNNLTSTNGGSKGVVENGRDAENGETEDDVEEGLGASLLVLRSVREKISNDSSRESLKRLDRVIEHLERLKNASAAQYTGMLLPRTLGFYGVRGTEGSDLEVHPLASLRHRRSWRANRRETFAASRSSGGFSESSFGNLSDKEKLASTQPRQTSDLGPSCSPPMLPETEEVGSIRQCSDLGMQTTQAATSSLEAAEYNASSMIRRRKKGNKSSKSPRPSCSSNLSGTSSIVQTTTSNAGTPSSKRESRYSQSRRANRPNIMSMDSQDSFSRDAISLRRSQSRSGEDVEEVIREAARSGGESRRESSQEEEQKQQDHENESQYHNEDAPTTNGGASLLPVPPSEEREDGNMDQSKRHSQQQESYGKPEDSGDEDIAGKPVFYTGLQRRNPALSIDMDDDGEGHGKEDEDIGLCSLSERTGSCSDSSLRDSQVPMLIMEMDKCQTDYLREQLLDWNFGPGGIFERLEDEKMPSTFKANPLTTVFAESVAVFDCAESLGFDLERMIRYMMCIEAKYMAPEVVQYHNRIHATDVLQAVTCFLFIDDVRLSLIDPGLSTFAALFSAAIHDVAHPGRNQAFHVKTQSHLSILYSDRSVLEHHHLAVAFSTLRANPEVNFLDVLDGTDSSSFREKVIQMVLSTDMAFHMENLNSLKEVIGSQRPLSKAKNRASLVVENDTEVTEELHTLYESDTNILLSSIVHICDISNVAKDWSIYKQWIPWIFGEFFAQGDEEKSLGFEVGLPYDRERCFPCEMQGYFIDLFVTETLDALCTWCPQIKGLMSESLENNKKQLKRHSRVSIRDMWT